MFGSKEMGFEVVEGWGKLPSGWSFGHVIGVDDEDNVYVLNRGEHSMVIFDREGNYLRTWEDVTLPSGHGLHIEGDEAYVADYKEHTVSKYTLNGRLLRTWGTPGVPGADGEPFNRPTDVDVAPTCEIRERLTPLCVASPASLRETATCSILHANIRANPSLEVTGKART